jgi:coenzyme F420-reducing hydrogenase alpha subunit
MKKTRTIRVNNLARVEGEGALYVKVQDGRVADVRLKIFEPPRFFEAFLRGRSYTEVPDIVARICGICPVAYQMSAAQAIEDAFGVRVGGQLRALRRLIYCGEWIASHALHVFMLHAPDFLGYEDAIRMARDHPDLVARALRLKQAGNAIMSLIGGREIHPINLCIGGFYRTPHKQELLPLREQLLRGRAEAVEIVRWAAELSFPEFSRDYEFVALRSDSEYPLNEGRLVSNKGLDLEIAEFETHFVEEHVARSNALHCVLRDRGAYLVGPLARYSLNFDKLSPGAQEAAREAGLAQVCANPFKSIIVRCVEMLYAFDEALAIIDAYEKPDLPAVPVTVQAGVGYGCTEAPRGMLYHRFEVDEQGLIAEARIVPPTSQNQTMIEEDLRAFLPGRLHLETPELTWQCEQMVRNYDPCISCATHFLTLEIDRL